MRGEAGKNKIQRLQSWLRHCFGHSADCDSGVEEGDCDSSTPAGVAACKKKCLDDPYCGGFNSDNHLKYADCVKDMQQSGSIKLWVLKDTPQPAGSSALVYAPPPPPDYDTWMRDLACLMDGNWHLRCVV